MHKLFAVLLLAIIVFACGRASSSAPSPTPLPSIVPSPLPSPSPHPSPGSGFYLRAWQTQALPPPSTFNWLPMVTIHDGMVIDGNVAVPAIYPGPLLIVPFARTISKGGTTAIVDEARRLGLLGESTDFTGGSVMPGARAGKLTLVVEGVTYDLTGSPDLVVPCGGGRCEAEAGAPQAFAAFWQELAFLDPWVGSELGPTRQYDAERLAVLLQAPARPEPGLEQPLVTWPLEATFHEIGVDFPGVAGARCVTLAGDELEAVLPVLIGANQLTVFVDAVDTLKSALAVVVVPGAESPCADS